ncbi:TPA: hypothetical protein I8Y21_005041 [Klebsiella oxytoca]|uniref:Uncharacterized protein n=1 Tax=Klebsiella oxytoca TaxID=571 RepID=A0AAN5LE05_KLEOX|nr:hypothetical protein [Klebsiella oxytoca]
MSNKNDNNSPVEYSENPKSGGVIIVETEIKNVKKEQSSPPPPPSTTRKK